MRMRRTCASLDRMAKMIQVRNVRPQVHDELMRRAKLKGMTLTAYIEEILEREVARPPAEEVFARIKARRARRSLPPGRSAAELIREDRQEREARWERLFSTPPR